MSEYDCIIVGGGPAGMVTGLLLARAGVRVAVLEQHRDFFRDFRGDTIHASTLRLLDELGLYEEFARLPHRKITQVSFAQGDGRDFVVADMSRLHVAHPFLTLAPQWDFLDLLARAGEREPTLAVRMGTEAVGLLRHGTRVSGVRVRSGGREEDLYAPLVIAADGRWSVVREDAGLAVKELHCDIDTWWFRVDTEREVTESIAPRAADGTVFIGIPRPGYVQVARLLPKGADERLRGEGIERLRADVVAAFPALADGAEALSWDDVKLLDIRRNRARRWWSDGVLCLGDAAHAMSPIGGVGVNLAVQDGVAAARVLARPLVRGRVRRRHLRRVQRRRWLTTTAVELLQGALHRTVERVVRDGGELRPPAPLARAVSAFPALTVVPARILGMGLTPEHAPRFARRSTPRGRDA